MLPSVKLKVSSAPQESLPNSEREEGTGEEEGCRQNTTGGMVVVIAVLDSHEYCYTYTVNAFLKQAIEIAKVNVKILSLWLVADRLFVFSRNNYYKSRARRDTGCS
jgi:hypothetical protein